MTFKMIIADDADHSVMASQKKTTKRLVLRCSAAALFGAIVIGLFLWQTKRPHQIHWNSFLRIKDGMTFEEVVAILGAPPGDYTTGPVRIYGVGEPLLGRALFERIELIPGQRGWVSDAGCVVVSFDQNGVAIGGTEYVYFVEPWLEKFRRWLGQH